MKTADLNKLYEMHNLIKNNGITSFYTKFLEQYTELLAESLEGKGNETLAPTSPRSDHSLV